jgi:hypothetical protein
MRNEQMSGIPSRYRQLVAERIISYPALNAGLAFLKKIRGIVDV